MIYNVQVNKEDRLTPQELMPLPLDDSTTGMSPTKTDEEIEKMIKAAQERFKRRQESLNKKNGNNNRDKR